MFYRGRELRRLWEIEVFDGDREDPECPTKVETVIAWNAVDAIRRTGDRAAAQPKALHFVTWAEDGDSAQRIFRINNTEEGPVGDPIEPSIALPELTDEDWK